MTTKNVRILAAAVAGIAFSIILFGTFGTNRLAEKRLLEPAFLQEMTALTTALARVPIVFDVCEEPWTALHFPTINELKCKVLGQNIAPNLKRARGFPVIYIDLKNRENGVFRAFRTSDDQLQFDMTTDPRSWSWSEKHRSQYFFAAVVKLGTVAKMGGVAVSPQIDKVIELRAFAGLALARLPYQKAFLSIGLLLIACNGIVYLFYRARSIGRMTDEIEEAWDASGLIIRLDLNNELRKVQTARNPEAQRDHVLAWIRKEKVAQELRDGERLRSALLSSQRSKKVEENEKRRIASFEERLDNFTKEVEDSSLPEDMREKIVRQLAGTLITATAHNERETALTLSQIHFAKRKRQALAIEKLQELALNPEAQRSPHFSTFPELIDEARHLFDEDQRASHVDRAISLAQEYGIQKLGMQFEQ